MVLSTQWIEQTCKTSFYKIPTTFDQSSFVGLPWWLSGKECTCQCRRRGFHPWSRKIWHATEQLRPCATTTEPMCHNYWSLRTLQPVLHNKRSHQNEQPTHCSEEQPLLTTARESPCTVMKTQHSQKYNYKRKSTLLIKITEEKLLILIHCTNMSGRIVIEIITLLFIMND